MALETAIDRVQEAVDTGADILISTCACLNMILIANGVKEIESIPVLDTVGTAIKTAEFLIDLRNIGIDRVNRSLYSRLAKEELMAIRKLHSRDP